MGYVPVSEKTERPRVQLEGLRLENLQRRKTVAGEKEVLENLIEKERVIAKMLRGEKLSEEENALIAKSGFWFRMRHWLGGLAQRLRLIRV